MLLIADLITFNHLRLDNLFAVADAVYLRM